MHLLNLRGLFVHNLYRTILRVSAGLTIILFIGCVYEIGKGEDHVFYIQFSDSKNILGLNDSLSLTIDGGAIYTDSIKKIKGVVYKIAFFGEREGSVYFLGFKVKDYNPTSRNRLVVNYLKAPPLKLSIEDISALDSRLVDNITVVTIKLN